MKRIILLFSALMLSCIALWAHDVVIDGIYYNLDKTYKTAEVTYYGDNNESYYDEYSGSVTIPETITYNSQTYSVTSIGDEAFRYCDKLTSVTIGNSVTSVGQYAFSDCYDLTSVTIGNSVTSIGYYAFQSCSGLTSVTIPNSVTSMGYYVFSGCSRLTSITIPNSVTSIGSYAFSGCSSLNSVTIPNSVTSIGSYAFKYCSGLTSVTIGNSVTSIGDDVFSGCSRLTSITIPNSVTSIGYDAFSGCSGLTKVNYLGTVDKWVEIDFENFNSNPTFYAEDLYINNELLTDVKITSADSIKGCAFYNCQSIKSVEIGKSVTSIGGSAFYGTSIYNNESNWDNGVLYIDNCLIDAKSDVVKGSYTIKEGTRLIDSDAFSGCSRLTSITIPNSVTSIGNYVFYRCSGLTSVTIPNSVTSIGSSAFEYCSGLTSVTIGNSVTSIGDDAFLSCSRLTSVTIGNSVTSIGDYAFSGCSGLTSVTIPNSVTKIGDRAFIGCSGLTSVAIPNSVTSIGSYAFYDCSGLTEVTIGNSVTSIGVEAFRDCSGLTKVNYLGTVDKWVDIDFEGYYSYPTYYAKDLYINNELLTDVKITSADSIKDYAFYYCRSIKSVEIGNSVTSIGYEAFKYCSGLTSVIWNAKNYKDFEDYDETPFYYIRSNITSFTFGNEVEHIPAYLCYDMENLKEVTIGNSVTSIGQYAFEDCSGLTKVNYLGTVDKWVEIDFDDYNTNPTYYAEDLYINNELLTDVKITSADSIKDYAFYYCRSIKSVEIGKSVTSIGYDAFEYCSGLTKVNYLGTVDKWVDIDFDSNPTYYAEDLYINNELLTDVKITSADSIKDYAFYYCRSIKSVEIGNSVTSIGQYAFEDCSGLTSVIWNAKNYKDFEDYDETPFYYIRSNITSFTFGNEVEHIPAYLCHDMSNIKTITIPQSVTSIGDGAFRYCDKLTSVTIGNSVTSIGSSAFSGCSGLTEVIWNAKNYKDFEDYNETPFYYRSNITSFTFGNEVEHIPAYLCYGMSKLTEITIPNSVTSIGQYAFKSCSGLTSVIWNAKNYKDCRSSTYSPFYDIRSSITSFAFGNEVEHIPAYLCYDMENLKEVTIGNSVTSIGDEAFSGCSGLTSITIGNSVTSIGSWAFNGCSGLTKVNYLGTVDKWVEIDWKYNTPNPTYYAKDLYINNELLTDVKITSADSIKYIAFYNCRSIKSVEIGKSVTSIGSSAFYNCSGLTSVTIGNSVTSIGSSAFYGCSGLTSITIGNSVTSIGRYAFEDCSGLTKVNYLGTVDKWVDIDFDSNPTYYAEDLYINNELLTDVKITTADSIKNYAFYNCRSIKSVEIGKSVTSIGSSAFSGCSGLTSVTIGNSVTSIGQYAFEDCSGLTKVNYLGTVDKWVDIDFDSNPTYYAEDLYINNELLTDVKITSADSIKYIAFYNCRSIKSVEIGKSVTSIGQYAFYNCSGLTSVTIGNSVTSIGRYAFEDCSGLTSVIWNAKNYKDFSSSTYSPFYDIRSSITSFTFCNEIEHIPAYLCYGMSKLTGITIPNSVTSIGEDAFDGCDKLRKVTAYPTTVPNAYENSFAHYNAYLYVPCDVYEDYDLDDVFGNFKYIKCIAAEEVDAPEKIEIEVDEDNNAIVIWPSTDGAKSYELVISKNGELFCTLLFNENGQLTSIDFGNRSASVGFQFTVTGLDRASKYAYSMVAMDKKGNELQSYKGTFTTNGSVDITETLADANITVSSGTISAEADFSIYNTIGQDVTAFNGSLQPGVYLVSIENDIVKVMVH